MASFPGLPPDNEDDAPSIGVPDRANVDRNSHACTTCACDPNKPQDRHNPMWMLCGFVFLFVALFVILWYLLMYVDIDTERVNRFLTIWLPGAVLKLAFLFGPLVLYDLLTPGKTIALIHSDKWTATAYWCVLSCCLVYLLTWA